MTAVAAATISMRDTHCR